GSLGHFAGRVVEESQAAIESAVELFFLRLEHGRDFLLPRREFGEDLAELGHEDGHEEVKKRVGRVEAEDTAEAHGPSQDVADDVVTTSIARLDSVGDGETDGADVVPDDAESDVDLLLLREAVPFPAFGHGRGVDLAGEGREF